MFRNVMVNAPWVIAGLWASVKGWLDPFVQQKISICSKKEDMRNAILKYVDENVLEEKYGGKRPNITGDTFPPQFIDMT